MIIRDSVNIDVFMYGATPENLWFIGFASIIGLR